MPTHDLIGDVHGCAEELEALLRALGYRERNGAYRHPEHPNRIALFVGDFLDRGPDVLRTLRLARAMLEAGSARSVLGNHELNAMAYHLPDPDRPGAFLRPHTEKNRRQHAATLAQVPAAELSSHLAFFRALPFAIDEPTLRVVHACWDPPALAVVSEALARHGGLTDPFLVEGHDPESLLYDALAIVVKGKEMRLPPGVAFTDKDGTRREKARVRWYLPPDGESVASYTLPTLPALAARPELSTHPLPAKVAAEARPYPAPGAGAPPVFFGHYWLTDPTPAPLAPNVACLDYSVARGGFLCAYRHDGAPTLDPARYLAQPAR